MSLVREGLRGYSSYSGRLRLLFSRRLEKFRARMEKIVRNSLVNIKTGTALNLFSQSTFIHPAIFLSYCYVPGTVLDTQMPQEF